MLGASAHRSRSPESCTTRGAGGEVPSGRPAPTWLHEIKHDGFGSKGCARRAALHPQFPPPVAASRRCRTFLPDRRRGHRQTAGSFRLAWLLAEQPLWRALRVRPLELLRSTARTSAGRRSTRAKRALATLLGDAETRHPVQLPLKPIVTSEARVRGHRAEAARLTLNCGLETMDQGQQFGNVDGGARRLG